jgi:cold-inducible RNA-binding protein
MTKLFLGNIPYTSSEEDIRDLIENRGFGIESVQIIMDRSTGKPRGFGFAVLKEEFKIHEAIQSLRGLEINGRVLTVNEATPLNSPQGDRRSPDHSGRLR